MSERDPYRVLGVRASASEAEIRAAYRRLVKLHHPDHNPGSAEAARRFEEVQEAYARIQRLRARPAGPSDLAADPALEARLAEMERQVRQAQAARDRAGRRAARRAGSDAAAAAGPAPGRRERPTDEELGYVTTDDSLRRILADARSELGTRFAHAREPEHPVARRVNDLIAGLEDLAGKLDRPPRGREKR
ncbi:MAG TPA: DnaJ domain-containing protein [Solirubrobacteraceae bacterium]|nr:DnaJ domain-containing protein [Solirubrobacteraceae bacterium]